MSLRLRERSAIDNRQQEQSRVGSSEIQQRPTSVGLSLGFACARRNHSRSCSGTLSTSKGDRYPSLQALSASCEVRAHLQDGSQPWCEARLAGSCKKVSRKVQKAVSSSVLQTSPPCYLYLSPCTICPDPRYQCHACLFPPCSIFERALSSNLNINAQVHHLLLHLPPP